MDKSKHVVTPDKLKSAFSQFKSAMLNTIYPIGAIYMSINSTDPGTLFGGTWERIKDTFLLSAGDTYSAGATGGEATHTLEKSEIPNYKIGNIPAIVPPEHQKWNNNGIKGTDCGTTSSSKEGIGMISDNLITSGEQWGWAVSTNGGDGAHNNMPPYLAVYVWKRTA